MSVITISRQVGSRGDEIAQTLAETMGLKLVRREDIHRLAQDCDADAAKACAMFESELPKGFRERHLLKDPSYPSLFASMIFELAGQGDAVILGRGSQIVLANRPGVLKVRMVAPVEQRVERVMTVAGLSSSEATEILRRRDHSRRALVESVFQRSLDDVNLYDLVLNTAGFSLKSAVRLIEAAAAGRPQSGEPDEIKARYADLALAAKVESAILKKVPTTPTLRLAVTMPQTGVALISGYVSDERARALAGEIAAKASGVSRVENRLKTTDLKF